MSKIFKNIISWCFAIVIAFLIVNIVSFFISRPVGWVDTPNGACRGIRRPYSILVHSSEGYGISIIDKNGYTNPDYPLNDSYILMMGASHSQGKEMPMDKKYSVLVNDAIAKDEEKLYTYNIAVDANFLPSIIKHFKSAITQYSGANCITIEIGNTDYSVKDIENSLDSIREYDGKSAEQLFSEASFIQKMKNTVKEWFPFTAIVKNKLETIMAEDSEAKEFEVDEEEYYEAVNKALSMFRDEFDGPIVFLYHPQVKIEKDGSMSCINNETIEVFQKACMNNNIDFINFETDFSNHYNETYEVPYGFQNTFFTNGHLNRTGHQIIAEGILDYLEEKGLQ